MKKKILLLGNSDISIYNYRLELVEKLLELGDKVIISAPRGKHTDDMISMGCDWYDIRISRHGTNPFEDLRLISDYKKLLKKTEPDIVFSFTIKPNIYGGIACKAYNVPYVANITGLGTATENKGLLQKIIILLYRIAFKNVRTVFFQNSDNMKFFYEHKIALGKYKLLPGSGVNLKKFQPLDYPNDDHIEFAFISRIMKEKGIDQYLEAAEYIKNKYPETIFHVCGFCEESYEKRLAELNDHGVIQYHGMVEDIRTILKTTHCTIHPTYYPEGLANILLESCACARPIITTDRSGCREVIDDEINGFVVRPQNTADLIDKVERFILLDNDERKKMGLEGRKKVEREFDRDIVVGAYLREVNAL